MTPVRVGLILSGVVLVAAIGYAAQDDRYPDLAWIADLLALMGAVVALSVIWLGVALVTIVARWRKPRP